MLHIPFHQESFINAAIAMGTYPTTPSLVLATGEDLQKHINANKEKLMGGPILTKFGVDLPFLPKVAFF
jgi:mannose-6-phosphate isomerase